MVCNSKIENYLNARNGLLAKIDYDTPKIGNSLQTRKKKERGKDNVLVGPWNNLQDMHVEKQDSEHCVV